LGKISRASGSRGTLNRIWNNSYLLIVLVKIDIFGFVKEQTRHALPEKSRPNFRKREFVEPPNFKNIV
jgi:hypothetical protein